MNSNTVLKMNNINKTFYGIKVLDNINFDLKAGEVHAICGANGAGKSTLLKVLYGMYQKDSGEILINDKEVSMKNVKTAIRQGIFLLPQEIQLAPDMTVAENVFLGHFPKKKFGLIDWREVRKKRASIQKLLAEYSANIDMNTYGSELSIGERQIVEIIKARIFNNNILAFDEPTASLSNSEIKTLFGMMRQLAANGMSIIYISHRLPEIFEICDRVTVLKDGKYIATKRTKDINLSELVNLMFDTKQHKYHEEKKYIGTGSGEDILSVKNLCKNNVYANISFELKKGEILGLYGMVGSGRTEVVRGILGADKIDRGEIYVEGKEIRIRSPRDAVNNNIGYISEDRLEQGIMPDRSVRWNMTLPFIKKLTNLYRIKHKQEKEIVNIYIRKTRIVTPSDSVAIKTLSGGNQQKVIVCSWMETGSKILLFDEPTKGIDLQSKPDIYHMMKQLVCKGKGIILISSDLTEILEMSDRILVFKNGKICARFDDIKHIKRKEILKKALE